jgi:hypothetical protein
MKGSTPKKPRESGGVNGGIPAWDHRPGDRVDGWYRARGTSEEDVLCEVNQPSSYERLPGEEKAMVREWILRELRPTHTMGPKCSYHLKHVYQRLTDRYLTNGDFKGAMLDAGYRPIDRTEPSWQFGYGFADSRTFWTRAERPKRSVGGRLAMTGTTMREAALSYARRGVPVFPLTTSPRAAFAPAAAPQSTPSASRESTR